MLRIQGLILLSLVYTLLIVAAVLMPSYRWVTIPAGAVITIVMMVRRRSSHMRKIENIQKRLTNLRSEGLFINEDVRGADGDVFYRMIMTLLTDLERSLFKLVEKNIQLLSIKEIGRNIISSLDENKLIDSVFEYLVHGVGYREVAFIFLRRKKPGLQAVVCIENANRMIRKVINLEFEDLKGAVYKSFVSGKAFLIKDAGMHKMLDAGGEPLFPGSTMTSYICVPLLKTSDRNRCCRDDECCLEEEEGHHGGPEKKYMSHPECLACSENPLLGAIIATDGFRASPLTNIDQVTIETVGSLVASNIENWMLYQELRQEEIFREKILEGMQHGLFVSDLDGNITLANRSALEMCQEDNESILDIKIDELVVSRSDSEDEPSIMSILKEGHPALFNEAYLKRSDGVFIPIRMYVSQLAGDDDEMQGAIILFVDLSEIKRMEEEIRHLDNLAVLGRFTSAIAHEIRNPLTGIAAGIQYLQRKGGLSSEQNENISFVLNEVDRLNRIITDLFKVAKPRDLLYQNVSIDGVIERSFKSVSEIFSNKEIEFSTDIKPDIPMVDIDPDQITQVLINLIKNSAEAVGQRGRVEVKADLYDGDDREVMREKERELICIEIRDNGPGIEEKDHRRIFEPFFSKKSGGTGLGLFVSHSIVQHHQGRINIISEPDEGTTFKVYLPVKRPSKGGKIEAGSTSGR